MVAVHPARAQASGHVISIPQMRTALRICGYVESPKAGGDGLYSMQGRLNE